MAGLTGVEVGYCGLQEVGVPCKKLGFGEVVEGGDG